MFHGRCQGSAAVVYKVKVLHVQTGCWGGHVLICILMVFRNSSCNNGMMLSSFIFLYICFIYICIYVCEYIFFSLSGKSPCPDHLCFKRCCTRTWSSHVPLVCSVSRWERHGEALCGARKADGGALRVTQDGLAVTACLSWRGSYDEEFLQSWPPQGTAEFHILHLPSSQTVWTDRLVCL